MTCESEWQAMTDATRELDELWPNRASADAGDVQAAIDKLNDALGKLSDCWNRERS
jgi:hypothetical protein